MLNVANVIWKELVYATIKMFTEFERILTREGRNFERPNVV